MNLLTSLDQRVLVPKLLLDGHPAGRQAEQDPDRDPHLRRPQDQRQGLLHNVLPILQRAVDGAEVMCMGLKANLGKLAVCFQAVLSKSI